jgi:hypothetical protein
MFSSPATATSRGWSKRAIAFAGILTVSAFIGSGLTLASNAFAADADEGVANCDIIVPANPLTAQGLATPYQLTGMNGSTCHESDADDTAWVDATILDPATGALSVYHPLVVDKGTQPGIAPVVPTLPANAVVGIWFIFPGNDLHLVDTSGSLTQGKCVNGLGASDFVHFGYCNAPAFFTAANASIVAGKTTIPAVGKAADGLDCPTVRDFSLIDDQQGSDMQTAYLELPNGTIALDTAANFQRFPSSKVLTEFDDERVTDLFTDFAIGCTPFEAPDLSNPGFMSPSLALDELQAAADQTAPVALTPALSASLFVNGKESPAKTDLFRAGVDMPSLEQSPSSDAQYCTNFATVAPTRIQQDMNLTNRAESPSPDDAKNLYLFNALRFSNVFNALNCSGQGVKLPVSFTKDSSGVVTGVTWTNPVAALTAPIGQGANNTITASTNGSTTTTVDGDNTTTTTVASSGDTTTTAVTGVTTSTTLAVSTSTVGDGRGTTTTTVPASTSTQSNPCKNNSWLDGQSRKASQCQHHLRLSALFGQLKTHRGGHHHF